MSEQQGQPDAWRTPPGDPAAPPPPAASGSTPYGATPPDQPTPDPQAYGQQAYGQQAYGTPGYGAPAYGTPGYGAPAWATARSPEASSLRTQAIVSLVLNGIALVFCLNITALGGIITSVLALSRVDQDVRSARTLVRWSWALLAVGFVLAIVGLVVLFAVLGATSTSTSTTVPAPIGD